MRWVRSLRWPDDERQTVKIDKEKTNRHACPLSSATGLQDISNWIFVVDDILYPSAQSVFVTIPLVSSRHFEY